MVNGVLRAKKWESVDEEGSVISRSPPPETGTLAFHFFFVF